MNNFESPIQIMYHSMMNEDTFGIEKVMETTDLDEIADWFVRNIDKDRLDELDLLDKFIQVMRYIEFETPISSTLSDEGYDRLVELYYNIAGKAPSAPDWAVDKSVAEHKYPELRGSLDKVHFLMDSDIPAHDSRKSLESWWRKVLVASDIPDGFELSISGDMKYDGHSIVFEMHGKNIHKALTRYRTDLNLGKDITHIFKGWTVANFDIPEKFWKNGQRYGVKTEVYMTYDKLEEFRSSTGNPDYNHRSAVASILSRKKGDSSLLNYLSVAPFQIASENEIFVSPKAIFAGEESWVPCDIINQRYQYINRSGHTYDIKFNKATPNDVIASMKPAIDAVKEEGNLWSTPIDGVVYTLFNPEFINALGRKNDINQFQIAFKFPTGVAKTKLKRVTFPVGPCAGTITPLAELEPVMIDGKKIESASLSNMDKLERLDLRVGDEVIIRYDIVPKLYKDDTCKKGKGPKVVIPNACPYCGGELSETYRCTNPECPSKTPGKIYNYVTKMRIPNIGKKTIEKLVSSGIWNGIHSLYRIGIQKDDILRIPGFGNTLINNMIMGVGGRMEVYPHELFGSIGIPDLATKTMKKVFQSVDFIELTASSKTDDERMELLTSVKGIGEKKAAKLIEGIRDNMDLITFLESHLTIMPYEDTSEETEFQQNVVFSNVRDKALESFLMSKGIGVSNTVSSKTVAVVIKPGAKKTTKIKSAEEKGIPVVSINEYKQEVGYL